MFQFFLPLSYVFTPPSFFLSPLVSLSFPQPSHSSLNIPQNLPVPSLFPPFPLSLSISLCAWIGVGARVLVEVRGLCEWPCERARAFTDKTRGGKGESEEKRRGTGHGHVDDVLVLAL